MKGGYSFFSGFHTHIGKQSSKRLLGIGLEVSIIVRHFNCHLYKIELSTLPVSDVYLSTKISHQLIYAHTKEKSS